MISALTLLKDNLVLCSPYTATTPTGLDLELGSGLESERDEDIKENDSELRIDTTSLSHQNSQCARVKGQPQVGHLVPPEPSVSTINPEEGVPSSDRRPISVAPCDAVHYNSIGVAMETDNVITPANKDMPSGATLPSTDKMDDKISQRPDTASPPGEKIILEEPEKNESFTSPEPNRCELSPDVCPNRTGGEPGRDQDSQAVYVCVTMSRCYRNNKISPSSEH